MSVMMHLRTRRASRVTMSRASHRVAATRFVATRAFALLTALGVGTQAFAIDLPIPIEEPKRDKEVEFHSEVAPLLRKSCLACHNEKVAEAGLNMETLAKMLKGGDNGPALVVGDAAKSLILARATGSEEPLMPPEDNSAGAKPLSPQELGLISLWIKQGAKVGEAKLVNSPAWQKIPQGFQPIYAIDVSPDGHYVASSRGSGVVIHEVAGFAEIGSLSIVHCPRRRVGRRPTSIWCKRSPFRQTVRRSQLAVTAASSCGISSIHRSIWGRRLGRRVPRGRSRCRPIRRCGRWPNRTGRSKYLKGMRPNRRRA